MIWYYVYTVPWMTANYALNKCLYQVPNSTKHSVNTVCSISFLKCWVGWVPNTCMFRAWTYGVWTGCEGQQKQNGIDSGLRHHDRAEAATYFNMIICEISVTLHSIHIFWRCLLQVKTRNKKIMLSPVLHFSIHRSLYYIGMACTCSKSTQVLFPELATVGKLKAQFLEVCMAAASQYVFVSYTPKLAPVPEGKSNESSYWRVSNIWVHESRVHT